MIGRSLALGGALALVACGSGPPAAGGSEGLAGTVYVSPATPVCRSGTSCSRPAKRFRLVFSRNGRSVIATTDSRGRYRVKLERGRYSVRPANRSKTGPKQGLQPSSVAVPRGRFAERDFTYDTGIR